MNADGQSEPEKKNDSNKAWRTHTREHTHTQTDRHQLKWKIATFHLKWPKSGIKIAVTLYSLLHEAFGGFSHYAVAVVIVVVVAWWWHRHCCRRQRCRKVNKPNKIALNLPNRKKNFCLNQFTLLCFSIFSLYRSWSCPHCVLYFYVCACECVCVCLPVRMANIDVLCARRILSPLLRVCVWAVHGARVNVIKLCVCE